MNNELTTQSSALADYNPGKATLLEMRADPVRFPRLKAMPREQAVFEMTKIVTQAFLYRGQAADENNIRFIATNLVNELLCDDKFGAPYLSLAEIQAVIKRAVLGDTEMFGISVASLYKIIMDFVKGEGHLNQVKVREMREAKPVPPQESVVHPMITAYVGQWKKNHNNK